MATKYKLARVGLISVKTKCVFGGISGEEDSKIYRNLHSFDQAAGLTRATKVRDALIRADE